MVTLFKITLQTAAAAWLAIPARAAGNTAAQAAASGADQILSLGAGLALVIAAILACGWVYSRARGVHASGGVFTVLAQQALGPKERILLVQIADKQLVIGMTAGRLQTLHVFNEPVIDAARSVGAAGFADRLRSALRAARK